jgi:hypothetical protein
MKHMKRYCAFGTGPTLIKSSNALGDVQRGAFLYGPGIIVDYKLQRFCHQTPFPVARPNWIGRLPNREDIKIIDLIAKSLIGE